jgi:hypothetical protein
MNAKVKDYKAPIRGIAKLILSLLTRLGQLFLSKIKDAEIRLMASGLLDSAAKTVDVLSDADPNDAQQLREIINGLISKGDFSEGLRLELLSKIQKLKNEDVRKALTIINGNAFPIAELLTDDNKDNSDQIKEYLVTFLRGESGMELFAALLSIILPPAYADTLTLLIVEALLSWLGENEPENNTAVIRSLEDFKSTYSSKMVA